MKHKITFPVMEVRMVPREMLLANNYNPNNVPADKMELLKQSIIDNGFCFPVVTIWSEDDEKFVDGIPADQPHIHGGVSKDDQNDIIRRFTAGEVRTLYITYGVGSYGLNLQSAHHIIFAEHTWDYAQRVQAEARIYRMGQKETCHYHDIVCDVPLERRIIGALDNKESFSNSLKKAIQSAKDMKKELNKFI